MEAVKTTIDKKKYYLTKNGSVVERHKTLDDGSHAFVFVNNSIDEEKNGIYVYYHGNFRHKSGNNIEENKGYDIDTPCDWLPDRIEEIKCNIKIGAEFQMLTEKSKTVVGEIYIVESISVNSGGIEIGFYNDEDQLSYVYDLKDILIREDLE